MRIIDWSSDVCSSDLLLSVKNLGAASVTGFDFAAAFLDQARELDAAGGLEATFVQSAIARIPEDHNRRFALALVTIGVLGWMPDLPEFFATAARLFKPGRSAESRVGKACVTTCTLCLAPDT